ncbi:ATP-dependent Clp protease proteolytic subunit [Actinoallomurus purpureus]|uniref:ClpP family protease n=1 Tax=Actinoallomurus purpureus TaxID=478114 RepID=UPI00209298C6|nr:ATP-dependent Clp protease proteolytic subunit [Actinoallomurus purpureus]MCO6007932.1 ATP-dependent Clp protease proteolytic subunit [Actinoallomurus purpureus]
MPSFPPEFPGDPARPSRPSWHGEPPGERPRPGAGPWPGEKDPLSDRLLDHRIILVNGHLDGAGEDPVTLHLRSPDGEIEAAFAVADTIGVLACPVQVLVAGQTGGPPLLVLVGGRRREMMPHATLWLTEPRATFHGDATDVAVREKEHRRQVDAFYIRLAETTGREVDEIREDARQNRLLTADDAIVYGLIDAVVTRP